MLSVNQYKISLTGATDRVTGAALISSGTALLLFDNLAGQISQNGNAFTLNTKASAHSKFALAGGNLYNNESAVPPTTPRNGTWRFAAFGDVTLSQSTGAAGATISISEQTRAAETGTMSMWPSNPELMAYSGTLYSGSSSGANSTTVSAWIFPIVLENNLKFNAIRIPISQSISTSATSINISYRAGVSFGIYTLNGNSLSLSTSYSNSQSYDQTTNANSRSMSFKYSMWWDGTTSESTTRSAPASAVVLNVFTGPKLLPLRWTANSDSLSVGLYWGVLAVSFLTSANNFGTLQSIGLVGKTYVHSSASGVWQRMFDATASINAAWPLMGQASLILRSDSLMPNNIATTDISSTAATANSSILNQSVWIQIASLPGV